MQVLIKRRIIREERDSNDRYRKESDGYVV